MTSSGAEPVSILFVDDEPAVLRAIQRMLRDSPFETLTADGPQEALALLRSRRIDVLVSDIDMPGMSGLELLRVVRREQPAVLRMLLTGGATLDRALDSINEGEVVRFFMKPFNPVAFRAALDELVDRVEKLRRECGLEVQKVRQQELRRWVEERFAGTLDVARDPDGSVVVDVQALDAAIRALGALGQALASGG